MKTAQQRFKIISINHTKVEKEKISNNRIMDPKLNSNRKFMVCDVDNTITESCQIVEDRMARQIDALHESNLFAFISGTNMENLFKMISSRLKTPHYLLSNTGTRCYYIQNRETHQIYADEFLPNQKKEIISALENLIKIEGLVPLASDNIQDRGSQITLSILGRSAPKESKDNYDSTMEKRKRFAEYLSKIIPDYDIHIGGTTSLDITRKGIDKRYGLKRFVANYGLSLKNITFFGDKLMEGGNDYPVKGLVKCVSVKNPSETYEKFKEIYSSQKQPQLK